ncbi:MAG: PAS domain S-box protein, partial [Chloroflexi bacterium]|nr:PAS domain S-box protein [Chloroflexota bacterium]
MSDRPELDSVPDDQGLARLLIANALDIIVILNADGTLRFASPSMKRVLGYWPTDLVGTNVLGLVHPEDAPAVRERFSHRVQHAGPGQPVEFRFRHQDGSWRSLEAMATNRLDDPRIAGLIVTCRDITDRKRVQEVGAQLVQEHTARAEAEAAVKARDIFVAIASHELRTPLTVLSGTGQLLLRDLDRGEAINVQQMRERLNVILDQTSKLNDLVGQLLDVSR